MLAGFVSLCLLAGVSLGSPLASEFAASQQSPASATQTKAETPWPPAGVVRVGAGVVAPRLIKETNPNYTAQAMDGGVQGLVAMEVVVGVDGKVGEVRVTRSLDRRFGLDDEAVATVKEWEFTPGQKDGVAVPVLVEVEMTFTLRK